jgi:hypothetical protein
VDTRAIQGEWICVSQEVKMEGREVLEKKKKKIIGQRRTVVVCNKGWDIVVIISNTFKREVYNSIAIIIKQ